MGLHLPIGELVMRNKSLLIPGVAALALALVACGGSKQVTSGAAGSSPAVSASSGNGSGSSAPAGSASSGAAGSSGTAGSSGVAGSSGGPVPAAFTCPTETDGFTLASGGDVNIQNLWQKNLIPAWEKACPNTKITFTFDTHSANANLDMAKIGAAIKSGKPVAVDVTDNFSLAAQQAGLTEPVTVAEIPGISKISPTAMAAVKSSAVPYRASSVLLAYDSTKVTNPPKTLADLLTWIKANPGKFTYNSPNSGGSGGNFVETVVDSKIPADVLTKMQTAYDPSLASNFAPGLAILKDLTPSVYQKTYPNGNQAVLDLLAKGEIQMAPVWSDQFLSAEQSGQLDKKIKVTQISDPSLNGSPTYLAIIKSSTRVKAAQAFIDWVLLPAQQSQIVTTIAGFPAIPISDLPANVQGAFAGINTQNLRPNLESKTSADLQKQWATTVAQG